MSKNDLSILFKDLVIILKSKRIRYTLIILFASIVAFFLGKRILKFYGARPSKKDRRDYRLAGMGASTPFSPSKFELPIPVIKNQGQVSSCVAHSISYLSESVFPQTKDYSKDRFSAGFVYGYRPAGYYSGEGMYPREAMKTLQQKGNVRYVDFPYNEEVPVIRNMVNTQISDLSAKAEKNKIATYFQLKNDDEIKTCLMNYGPVSIMYPVHNEFMFPVGGKIDVKGLTKFQGYHQVSLYGWNENYWLMVNSWGCYDEKTEVLTKDGFKYFNDVSVEDEIATLKDGKILEYQKPTEITNSDYAGKMNILKSSKIDLLITPNHKVYHKTQTKDFHLREVKDIYEKNIWIKRDADWQGLDKNVFTIPPVLKKVNKYREELIDGLNVDMNIFVEFLGYYLSEGSTNKQPCKKGGYQYQVCISQTKENNLSVIENCLKKLPFKWSRSKNEKQWTTSNFQLYSFCKQFGSSDKKYIPKDILELNKEKLTILFKALMLGDGSITKSDNESLKVSYYTSSKQLKDDFQELCLKIGLTSSIFEDNRIGRINSGGTTNFISYQIRIQNINGSQENGNQIENMNEIMDYVGKVYCVTVPNHIIFIRRNGKTCWCGNSDWGNKGTILIDMKYPWSEAWGISLDPNAVIPLQKKTSLLKLWSGLKDFFKND